MDREEFSDLFLNEELTYVETYFVDKYPLYKMIKEIYQYKNNFYMMSYTIYSGEDIHNIVIDREFEVEQCVPVDVIKTVREWHLI